MALGFEVAGPAVVGQNGAGKTTLLELVSALIRNDFRQFSGENFRLQFVLVDGEFTLRGRLIHTVNMAPEQPGKRSEIEFDGTLEYGTVAVHVESDAVRSQVGFEGRTFPGLNVIHSPDAGVAGLDLISEIRRVIPKASPRLAPLYDLDLHDFFRSRSHKYVRLSEALRHSLNCFLPMSSVTPHLLWASHS